MLIQISNLTKKYRDYTALDAISLQIASGKIIGLLGANGSGKTTLLKILSGLIHGYSGEVLIDHHAPSPHTKSLLAYLPDKSLLPPHYSIQSACKFFSDFYADFNTTRAQEYCHELGLDTKARLKSLSKGNQEKVALLLTLARDARLYLLDEPIVGVDAIFREKLLGFLARLRGKDSTIIIATHLITYVQDLLDEVIFIQDGAIKLHQETPLLLAQNPSLESCFKEFFSC